MEKFVYRSVHGKNEYICGFIDEQFSQYNNPYCMSYFDGRHFWWPKSNIRLLIPGWEAVCNLVLSICHAQFDKIILSDGEEMTLVREDAIQQYAITFGKETIHKSIVDCLWSGPWAFRQFCIQMRFDNRYNNLLEEKIKKDKKGYIYLIRSISGYYKIGRTKDITNRIKIFKSKLPFEVELTHSFECDDYVKAERELHKKYAHCRINGEWFNLTDDEVTEIVAIKSYSVEDNK